MKKTNLLKAAVSLLLSATVLLTGCTALTDGVTSGDAVTVDGARRSSSYRNVMYTTTYTDNRLGSAISNPDEYSHICLFSVKIKEGSEGKKAKLETSSFKEAFPRSTVKSFKNSHSKVKLLLCFGGDDKYLRSGIGAAIDYDEGVTLARRLVEFMINEYGGWNSDGTAYSYLDGIDLDWEYHDDWEFEEYGPKYNRLVRAIHNKFKEVGMSYKIISMAVPSNAKFLGKISSDRRSEMIGNLSFISVMCYNPSDFEKSKSVMSDFAYYVNKSGYSKSKLNVGIPFYGVKKSNSSDEPGYKKLKDRTDNGSKGEYVGYDGTYYFPTPATTKNRAKWARRNSYGGVMTWQAGHDYKGRLQNAVIEALK